MIVYSSVATHFELLENTVRLKWTQVQPVLRGNYSKTGIRLKWTQVQPNERTCASRQLLQDWYSYEYYLDYEPGPTNSPTWMWRGDDN
jgi:hypothetical protein